MITLERVVMVTITVWLYIIMLMLSSIAGSLKILAGQ